MTCRFSRWRIEKARPASSGESGEIKKINTPLIGIFPAPAWKTLVEYFWVVAGTLVCGVVICGKGWCTEEGVGVGLKSKKGDQLDEMIMRKTQCPYCRFI